MTAIYAVEAWVLAIMGWGWLSVQEAFAWSLLSAFVFYGLICLSTLNLVMVAIYPSNVGVRSAYFSVVLVLALYSVTCVFDCLFAPSMGSAVFEAPFANETGVKCTFAQTQQLFFFGSSFFFIVQAAALVGYLVIQVLVAGAGMLDSELGTVWPGTAWHLSLCMLLCCRMILLFDGTPKGIASHPSRYIQLFSLPLVEYVTVFAIFLYLFGALLGVEGILFDGLPWRKGARYVTFVATSFFLITVLSALLLKGMLTPSILCLLLLILFVSVYALVEAVRAKPGTVSGPGDAVPQAPPVSNVPSPYPLPVAFGRQAIPAGRSRFYIPSAVEMSRAKNKGV